MISKAARGQGLGEPLLRACEKLLYEQNVRVIETDYSDDIPGMPEQNICVLQIETDDKVYRLPELGPVYDEEWYGKVLEKFSTTIS